MTISLDQMIAVGSWRITVLSDCAVNVVHSNEIVFFTGSKRPVAFLIRQGTILSAFALEGNLMTREQVEDLYPGAWGIALEAR